MFLGTFYKLLKIDLKKMALGGVPHRIFCFCLCLGRFRDRLESIFAVCVFLNRLNVSGFVWCGSFFFLHGVFWCVCFVSSGVFACSSVVSLSCS